MYIHIRIYIYIPHKHAMTQRFVFYCKDKHAIMQRLVGETLNNAAFGGRRRCRARRSSLARWRPQTH